MKQELKNEIDRLKREIVELSQQKQELEDDIAKTKQEFKNWRAREVLKLQEEWDKLEIIKQI